MLNQIINRMKHKCKLRAAQREAEAERVLASQRLEAVGAASQALLQLRAAHPSSYGPTAPKEAALRLVQALQALLDGFGPGELVQGDALGR